MLTVIKKLERWSGIAGIVIVWTLISFAMHRAGLGFIDSRPISYLGVDPSTATLFSICLLVSAGLFISFGFYVKRAFQANNRFIAYLLIGQIGQIIAALAPFGGQYRLIHTIAAFTLAFSLPLLIQQFKLSQLQSPHIKLYSWLLALEGVAFVIGIGLFVFTKGVAPLGEALPAIGFHVWILIITSI